MQPASTSSGTRLAAWSRAHTWRTERPANLAAASASCSGPPTTAARFADVVAGACSPSCWARRPRASAPIRRASRTRYRTNFEVSVMAQHASRSPLGAIFIDEASDGPVPVASTRLEGMTDFVYAVNQRHHLDHALRRSRRSDRALPQERPLRARGCRSSAIRCAARRCGRSRRLALLDGITKFHYRVIVCFRLRSAAPLYMAVHSPQPLSTAKHGDGELCRISICFDGRLPADYGADRLKAEKDRLIRS